MEQNDKNELIKNLYVNNIPDDNKVSRVTFNSEIRAFKDS